METNKTPIILIDDTEDDAFFSERLLRSADAKADIGKFLCPVEAIDYLARLSHGPIRPSICFVDIRMPRLNGIDVATWIRSHPEFDPMPVVMLSGSDEPRDLENARNAGADCYLKKFPSAAEMRSVLECAAVYRGKPASPQCEEFMLPCNLLSTLPPAS
jgi:CheY-like chemotaxis protein